MMRIGDVQESSSNRAWVREREAWPPRRTGFQSECLSSVTGGTAGSLTRSCAGVRAYRCGRHASGNAGRARSGFDTRIRCLCVQVGLGLVLVRIQAAALRAQPEPERRIAASPSACGSESAPGKPGDELRAVDSAVAVAVEGLHRRVHVCLALLPHPRTQASCACPRHCQRIAAGSCKCMCNASGTSPRSGSASTLRAGWVERA